MRTSVVQAALTKRGTVLLVERQGWNCSKVAPEGEGGKFLLLENISCLTSFEVEIGEAEIEVEKSRDEIREGKSILLIV